MIDFSETELNGMVVGLKGNCSALLAYAQDAFASANEVEGLDTDDTTDKRGTRRVVEVMAAEPEKMGENWQKVTQIVRVKRSGIRYKGKKKSNKKSKKKKMASSIEQPTPLPVPATKSGKARSKNAVYFEETSYYVIIKRKVIAKEVGALIKGHWAIEEMHRAKDVQYNEDGNKIKCTKLAPNLSQILNFTLNIFTLTGQKSITTAHETLANRPDKLFALIATTNHYLPEFIKKQN